MEVIGVDILRRRDLGVTSIYLVKIRQVCHIVCSFQLSRGFVSELFKNFSYIYENYDGLIMIRMILITFNDLQSEVQFYCPIICQFSIRNL